MPTTADESTPPERKAPSGTSLIMCDTTASRNTPRNASTASCSDPANVSAALICQYCLTSARPLRQRRKCAGGSFRIPSKIDVSRGVYWNAR
jgi:hypothetical protein